MQQMHDMHFHLDFAPYGNQLADMACQQGRHVLAATVTPANYQTLRAAFAGWPAMHVALGLHPWWVTPQTVERQLAVFERCAGEARLIGEVGLDFGAKHADARDAQMTAFRTISAWCGQAGGKVMSIHAVRSAREVLDILRQTGALDSCTCVFHWYSGPVEELHQAVRAGCLFSVNRMMAASRRGREYIKLIPLTQMLLETDDPEQGSIYGYDQMTQHLQQALQAIEQVKGQSCAGQLQLNSLAVLGESGQLQLNSLAVLGECDE